MVYNPTRSARFPFSNATMRSHTKRLDGSGMGSVLLRKGGPGAGSSYTDIDDYVRTTGINPYARAIPTPAVEGSGMKSLASKLSRLQLSAPVEKARGKIKNITMSM